MLDSGSIGFATAFAAGVISFLSPCVLPLVPGYLSYVAGTSLETLRDRQSARLESLGYALCFVLGFSTVFVAFGASATALGGLLLSWRYELGIVAGIVVLLFGLHMAGLLPIHLLEREARFHADIKGGRVVGAFLLGLAFAFGWTPCIGPVLGVILTMSASSADLATGTALLAVYSLGARPAVPVGRAVHRRAAGAAAPALADRSPAAAGLGRPAGGGGRADDHRSARGHGLLAARDVSGSWANWLRPTLSA